MKKIILLTILIVFMSCKDSKLSNSEALTIIKENYKSYCSLGIGGRWNDSRTWPKLDRLKNKGLLNVKNMRSTDIWKKEYKTISLTSEGQNYFDDSNDNKRNSKKVIIAKDAPYEVLGISYQENKAQVKFKTKVEKTPFYILVDAYHRPRCVNDVEKNSSSTKTITLTKYDTGWQIDNQ